MPTSNPSSYAYLSFDDQIIARVGLLLAERSDESLSVGVQYARTMLAQAHQAYQDANTPVGDTDAGFLLWLIDCAMARPYGNSEARFVLWLLDCAVDTNPWFDRPFPPATRAKEAE